MLSQFLPMLSALPLIGFWMWMFTDMWRNPSIPANARTTWTIAFLFGNVFTAAYYWARVFRDQP